LIVTICCCVCSLHSCHKTLLDYHKHTELVGGKTTKTITKMNETTLQKIIERKRCSNNMEFKWFIKHCMKGLSTTLYNTLVETGEMSPDHFFSVSDEAFALVTVESNWERWKAEAQMRKDNTYNKEHVKELPKSEYTTGGLQGGGWSVEGLNRYNQLVIEIKANPQSAASRKFQKERQEAHNKKPAAKKRKAPVALEVTAFNDYEMDSDAVRREVMRQQVR